MQIMHTHTHTQIQNGGKSQVIKLSSIMSWIHKMENKLFSQLQSVV